MTSRFEIDPARCEAWIDAALAGEASARTQLVEYLYPHWMRMARASRQLVAIGDDAAEEVVAVLVAKLGDPARPELARYREWQAKHPDKTFADWIRIALANAARDLARGALPSPKRLLNELRSAQPVDDLGHRPPFTAAQTARQILDFASRHLPADQHAALAAWLEGASFDDIEADAASARRLVRAAVATLRREFAAKT